jgi:hypothetical protein
VWPKPSIERTFRRPLRTFAPPLMSNVRGNMDAAAKSLVVFGAYLLLNAVGLVLTPNVVLGLFGVAATSEPWIRVLGLVAGVVGYYYIFAARHGLRGFYPATVHGRGVASLVFLGLVLTKVGPWQLLIFGAVDLAAALWTHLALKQRDA